MPSPPRPPPFASPAAFKASLGDRDLWGPLVAAARAAADLDPGAAATPGHNATYPTFVSADAVVKVYGEQGTWRESAAAERLALTRVAADPGILAPRLLAAGELFPGDPRPWPYLVMSRAPGVPLWQAALDEAGRTRVAAALGRQLNRIQALPAAGLPRVAPVGADALRAALARSSLPPRLHGGAPGFVARHAGPPATFVHGDLVANHCYVADGRLAGLIDWGDAMAADPHLELGKLFAGAAARDRGFFATCLDAAGWARGADFAPRTLAQAILRQAKGLEQHRGFDVFDGWGEVVDLGACGTLDELAAAVFGG